MKHLEFHQIVKEQLERTFSEELNQIELAAQTIAKTLRNDGLIHVFGCGHSQMFAQELFYRAGGLVQVNALLTPHLSIYPVAKLSTLLERSEGIFDTYLSMEFTSPGDTLIIVSVSGRNAAVVDMALKGKELGMNVIALTSIEFSESVTSRHSKQLKLADVSDLIVDIKCVAGDAVMEIEGLNPRFSGTSTILGMTILQSVMARSVEICMEHGYKPPIWVSSNTEEGDEINQVYIEKYKHKISCL